MEMEYCVKNIDYNDVKASFKGKCNTKLTAEECSKVFDAVIKNMVLYEHIYKDKVFKIDTTLENKGYFISIGKAKLLHLLGFEFYKWQKKYKKELIEIIPCLESVLAQNYQKLCANDDELLYNVLEIITEKNNKEKICDMIAEGSKMSEIFNVPKIKTKNFAFERLGILERASGMIIYDKNKDIHDGRIKSDLFILKDLFPRDWVYASEINWIFNGYAHEVSTKFKNSKAKNAETLLIEKDTSSKFANQIAAVSTSVGSINKSDFDFVITELLEPGEGGVDDYFMSKVEFDENDIENMAEKFKASFLNLDYSSLNEYLLKNSKRRIR